MSKIKLETNLVSYSDWLNGNSGSTEYFGSYIFSGGDQYISNEVDMFGNSTNIWNNSGSSTSSRLYWNNSYGIGILPVDITKTYRFSVWARYISGSTSCLLYYGAGAYNAANTAVYLTRIDTGGNYLYFKGGGTFSTDDTWKLLVGYVHPYSYTGTTNEGIAYNTNGSTFSTLIDLKWQSGTTQTQFKITYPYNGITKTQLVYPRIDLIDGTEPSIATLLSNEGPWRTALPKQVKLDTNLLDYSTWQTGQTGSVGQFTQYIDNSLNSRINYTNPFGNIGIAWKTNAVNTGLTYFRAGFNTTNLSVDTTKSYRCSLWVKKNTDISAASKCYLYTGVQAYASDGTTLVNTIDLSTGTQNSNQQGVTIQTPVLTANTWYLYNYTIRPTTWTGTTDNTTTGIYIPSGYKLVFTNEGIGDYKFVTGTTYLKFKGYFPFQYATADLNAEYEICFPRIDLIDGTEPSIATLLSNEGPWRTINSGKISDGINWKDLT